MARSASRTPRPRSTAGFGGRGSPSPPCRWCRSPRPAWLRPLRELERGATALGEGDLSTRVAERDGPPEVRAVARAFNDTARRLEELVGAQDAFVAAASHQLRSPLTALRLRLENLEPALAGEDAEELDAALTEAARLSRLIDGLLALARADRAAA